MRIVERLQATVYRVLLSASAVDQDVRNDADDAVKATVALLKQAEAALEDARRVIHQSSYETPATMRQRRKPALANIDALLAKLHKGGE